MKNLKATLIAFGRYHIPQKGGEMEEKWGIFMIIRSYRMNR
jgi:hypothetical protein